jgi:hypothetical protein
MAGDREVTVRLAAPLGNRVLIWGAHGWGSNTLGSPLPVVIPRIPDNSKKHEVQNNS